MRNLRHFTIDVGENAVDGIRYFATNSGILKDVRVIGRGRGTIGVNAGFLGQSGPNLVQDVAIEGFETGVLSQWIWGQTLSRVSIKNCRVQGLSVTANTVAVEDLTVEGTPLAIACEIPNDWYWWGGVVALIGGRFTGGDPAGPAIRNRGVLYARNVSTTGFARAIESPGPDGGVAGTTVSEYVSQPPRSAFESPPKALGLPVKREPVVPWELDPNRWVCANDFGAVAGDNRDDTAALQRAIDAAAAARKTTVFLRGIQGPDPNWYNLDGEVVVKGSVRHLIGLGFGRILGGKDGRIVIDDDPAGAPVVKVQHIDAFGGPPVVVMNRSASRSLVVESCGVRIVGEGRGDLFATDCPSLVELRKPGQRLWARQLNPEGDDDVGLVRNRGGDLWALGVKCEGRGVRFRTEAGGRTEIFGMFVYGPGIDPADTRPIFDVENASLSVAGLREIAFDRPNYPIKVRERRGGEVRTATRDPNEHGWIGWALYNGWRPRVK